MCVFAHLAPAQLQQQLLQAVAVCLAALGCHHLLLGVGVFEIASTKYIEQTTVAMTNVRKQRVWAHTHTHTPHKTRKETHAHQQHHFHNNSTLLPLQPSLTRWHKPHAAASACLLLLLLIGQAWNAHAAHASSWHPSSCCSCGTTTSTTTTSAC